MVNSGVFVSYLRVSTQKQGRSGLGVEAQREAVNRFLNGGEWSIIAEFVEVESGRNSARPELERALAACRLHRAVLVVAKLDRLTRSVAFLSRLLETGVEVRFCDLPDVAGPQGRFLLNSMVAVAELEAGLISERTKSALAAAKRRGKALGGYRGTPPTQAARDAAKASLAARTAARRSDLAPTLRRLESEGVTSLAAIARELTAKRIPTARGGAKWSAVQVGRVLSAK